MFFLLFFPRTKTPEYPYLAYIQFEKQLRARQNMKPGDVLTKWDAKVLRTSSHTD